jgi:hypothetical protein
MSANESCYIVRTRLVVGHFHCCYWRSPSHFHSRSNSLPHPPGRRKAHLRSQALPPHPQYPHTPNSLLPRTLQAPSGRLPKNRSLAQIPAHRGSSPLACIFWPCFGYFFQCLLVLCTARTALLPVIILWLLTNYIQTCCCACSNEPVL